MRQAAVSMPRRRARIRHPRHGGRGAALCAVLIAATCAFVGGAGSVGASIPTNSTFTFSGALRGTVTLPNGLCSGSGGQFSFLGSKLKGVGAHIWTVDVNAPSSNGGTWKKFTSNVSGGSTVSVVLQAQTSSRDYYWITKSGRVTTAKSSGSVHVVLGPDHSLAGLPGKGTITLIGSWGCTSG